MSDDLKNAGPQDRARINIHEVHEVAYWTKELGVSKERLMEVIGEVGPSAKAVRDKLGKE
jgi:hypothetical protein